MELINQKQIEEGYRKPTKSTLWDMGPNEFISKIEKLIPKDELVLDLGCGEGRNAIYFARKGFNVKGIDLSKDAIDRFNLISKKENLNCKGIVGDICSIRINGLYGTIICVGVLHLLNEKKKIEKVINQMKNNTKKGGINFVEVFTKEDPASKESKNMYFFDKDEIKSLYSGWKIIRNEYYCKEETHGLPLHKHYLNLFIGKKNE